MLRYGLFVACLLFASINYAQRPSGAAPTASITGTLLDSTSAGPLEYATISVSNRQGQLVSGAISNERGVFKIEGLRPGGYILSFEFIGYTKKSRPIRLKPGATRALGIIYLNESQESLKQVEIVEERDRMQVGLDKRSFAVSQDISATAGTASEVLGNIPSVTVESDGSLSLRGNSNVRILIDGRPSGLLGTSPEEALQQLPSDIIERIEIITNPSARYEAEGLSGIINIVLKQDRKKGLNGSITAGLGYPYTASLGANLSWQRQKTRWIGGYSFRYNERPWVMDSERLTLEREIESELLQESDMLRFGGSHTFRFGFEQKLSSTASLTTMLNTTLRNRQNESTVLNTTQRGQTSDALNDERSSFARENEPGIDASILFKKKLKKSKQNLTADMRFSHSNEFETTYNEDYALDQSMDRLGQALWQQNTINDERQSNWVGQADYVHPLREDERLEFGLRSSWRGIATDFDVEELDTSNGTFVNSSSLSNSFEFTEWIHAAYAIYGRKAGKLSYQVGLRLEQTSIETRLIETNEESDRTYANLFPSGFLGYELNDKTSLQLSYSARIRRPRFRSLNPFFSFRNQQNVYAGNPFLNPERSNRMELGYLQYVGKGSISAAVYFTHTDDVIQRISRLEDNGLLVRRPENLTRQQSLGGELILTQSLLKKAWRAELSTNVYRQSLLTDNASQGLATDFWAITGKLNNRFTLNKKTSLQLLIQYRGPRETVQGSMEDIWFTDLGLNRELLKGKATLTFKIQDVFNSRWYRFSSEGEGFSINSDMQWRPRTFALGFVYRINEQERRRGRRPEGGFSDDEMP